MCICMCACVSVGVCMCGKAFLFSLPHPLIFFLYLSKTTFRLPRFDQSPLKLAFTFILKHANPFNYGIYDISNMPRVGVYL